MFGASGRIKLDFDKLLAEVNKGKFKSLAHAAASIRKEALSEIKPNKEIVGYIYVKSNNKKGRRLKKLYQASPPGSPPFTHRSMGFFRRGMQFDVTENNAIIGVTASVFGDVMRVHEHSGERFGQHFDERAFMAPALAANADRFAMGFEGSVGT